MIKYRRPDKITRTTRSSILPPVSHKLGCLSFTSLNVIKRPLLIRLANYRTQKHPVIGAITNLKLIRSRSQTVH
ncbi:hypothetical protein D3C81_1955270 [compost metagenome]